MRLTQRLAEIGREADNEAVSVMIAEVAKDQGVAPSVVINGMVAGAVLAAGYVGAMNDDPNKAIAALCLELESCLKQ